MTVLGYALILIPCAVMLALATRGIWAEGGWRGITFVFGGTALVVASVVLGAFLVGSKA